MLEFERPVVFAADEDVSLIHAVSGNSDSLRAGSDEHRPSFKVGIENRIARNRHILVTGVSRKLLRIQVSQPDAGPDRPLVMQAGFILP